MNCNREMKRWVVLVGGMALWALLAGGCGAPAPSGTGTAEQNAPVSGAAGEGGSEGRVPEQETVSQGPGPSEKESDGLEPVTIPVSNSLVSAQSHIALAKGYFQDYGIDPQPVPSNPGQAIPLLVAEQQPFYPNASPSGGLNNAVLQGAPVVVTMDTARIPPAERPNSGLFVSDRLYRQGVRSIADLKGQTINIYPNLYSTSGRAVTLLLEKAGLSQDDVTFAPWNDNGKLQQAFIGGAVDVAYLLEPGVTVIEKQVKIHALGTSSDVMGGEVSLFSAINRDWAEQDPERAVALHKAQLLALNYLQDAIESNFEKNSDVLDILNRDLGVDKQTLRDANWGTFVRDGRLSVDSIEGYMKFFQEMGQIEQYVPVREYAEPSYAQKAYEELKAEGRVK